jgi:DNA-binding transcriptional LysR family regulator
MRLPDFEAWGIFAAVAEQRSFTGAAAELGLSKATVSKAVTRLEQQLGAPLFHRTSRRLALTQSGAKLVDHARRILAEGEAAQEAARDEAGAPSGSIRLAVPLSFGLCRVAPLLAEFLTLHPAITVDLHLSDAQVDLIGEGFDLGLRIARLPDSSLRARRLCAVKLHTLASPGYLRDHGEPSHPGQLGEHRCLAYAQGKTPSLWSFTGADGSEAHVRPLGPLQVNNGDAMLPALCAGLGVGQLPDFICDGEIAAGRLVPILRDWAPPPLALHLLSPPGTLRTRRVTALADFMVERLARPGS